MDTMGQDRPFTDEQMQFVLDSVQHYSDTWTQTEINNLKADIVKRYETSIHDKEYEDGELAQTLQAEEEKFIDEYYDSLDEPVEEEEKVRRLPVLQHKFLGKRI